MTDQQIQIFTSQDGRAQLEVALDRDTVWLSQAQMATLFDTSADNISLHLKNIYQEGELSDSATTEESSVVRQEGKRHVRREIKHYNLDAIISVGYRVSSQRATQFRQWATRVLKDHLVQGYSLNQRRLTERGLEFEQGFGDELFYPNVASRAAHLLYFLVKNHSLADGNKRCGSFLFLWYLRRNQHLLARPVEQLINDNTLVALALLAAESLPDQKTLMIRLIEHFILLREPSGDKGKDR